MSARREGYTTGSCAAAAAKAALLYLAEGVSTGEVEIPLPDGQRCRLPVCDVGRIDEGAKATVRKEAGDDPDVTNGAQITAAVVWIEGNGMELDAGEGVGTVTKPGLAVPPGRPAINPVPQRMIREAIREVTTRGVRVTISIAGGGELAAKTFNPRLGIQGGLSILGTTGIVRPFNCSALRETIRCALSVAAAAGIRVPVFVPGHIGERAARRHFRVTPEQVVEIGNEWGFAIEEVVRHPFTTLLMVGHPGKLAKLTAGDWDTHSGRSGSALPIVQEMHRALLGRPATESPTVEGIFSALDGAEKQGLGNRLAEGIQRAVGERMGGRLNTAVVLIDLGGRLLGEAGEMEPWQ